VNRPIDPSAEKRRWARQIAVICSAGAALGLFTANPLVTAAGMLVPPVLFILLWTPSEPPVLLFAAAFQWSQVFVPVLRADSRGEALGQGGAPPELETAAWLGLAAIVALAAGMRVGRGDKPVASRPQLGAWATELSPSRLLLAYALALAFSVYGAAGIGQEAQGLRQGFLALGLLRWMAAFLVLWSAMTLPRFRPAAAVVLVVELVLGFGGFFSSFKTVIFLGTIVVLGNEVRLVRLLRPRVIALLAVGLLLMTYWQTIKGDYRPFLNQGTQAQTELVSPLERAEFLIDRTTHIGLVDMYDGFDAGIQRLGYLDFFAVCIHQVPNNIPYQRGRLWGEAISHVLMPRLFFPSKPAINDSERTNEFSGMRVAGEEQGTTISLGYVTESYIDFGPGLMFAPILILGTLWGWSYRWLTTRSSNGLLGLSAATTVILTGAILFETSNIKILGGALTNVMVLSVVLTFWGAPLWSVLTEGRLGARRPWESQPGA
jgi:hypothetical protein